MALTLPAGPRLTPGEVQGTWFQPARLGHRGLDQGQVKEFCARVEGELTLLLKEKQWLEREVERLRTPGPDSPEAEAGEAHVHAVRILAKAQQTADQYVADAQEYSRQLAEDARRRRDEIVADARHSAAMVLDQAHAEATRAATALPAPVPEELMNQSEVRQLQSELAYLRTFSDVCRTHLRAYLEALARNVDEWERVERTPRPAISPAPSSSPDQGRSA